MYQDFKELLSLFTAHKVKYPIVGGYAVSFAEFGAPLEGLTPEDLVEKGKFYRIGHPPLMIDILPEISGIDFDTAWKKRVEVEIDRHLPVLFIDMDSLLAAKFAAGRPEEHVVQSNARYRSCRHVCRSTDSQGQGANPRTRTPDQSPGEACAAQLLWSF